LISVIIELVALVVALIVDRLLLFIERGYRILDDRCGLCYILEDLVKILRRKGYGWCMMLLLRCYVVYVVVRSM